MFYLKIEKNDRSPNKIIQLLSINDTILILNLNFKFIFYETVTGLSIIDK
jgi:hypothetical protein